MRNMTSAAFATLASSYPHPNTLQVSGKTLADALLPVTDRVRSIPGEGPGSLVDRPWREIRERLLWAGSLKVDRSMLHAFDDDNHYDLTTTLADPSVVDNRNADGTTDAISRNNFLGDHIQRASVSVDDDGDSTEADGAPLNAGSWGT